MTSLRPIKAGEEIYHNTTMPTGLGSWATDGEALEAIGKKIGDELSRELFLQHVTLQPVALPDCVVGVLDGKPGQQRRHSIRMVDITRR